MKVILLESVSSLGVAGDLVNVRPGYARNFLFPRQKAITATERNIKARAHEEMLLQHKLKRARKTAEQVKEALAAEPIVITKKSADTEKLFGSVTTMDIEKALTAKGLTVSRRAIRLEEPIKKLGKYEIAVKLDGGLDAKITLEVKTEGE